MTKFELSMSVNGMPVETAIEPHATLLELLRGELGLTGAKENCLEAECGVCTVLVDGAAVASCILLAAQCQGKSITTIEGLAEGSDLHPIQEAFLDHGAVQCGFCIPGMVLTAKSFLDENEGMALGEEDIREGLCGTLCRCTGYQKIVDAVVAVAETGRRA